MTTTEKTPRTDADKHAKMRDMVMSWNEISDELIWGAYDVNGPEHQDISDERLEVFCKRFPHFEERLRSFVGDWNKEPMITQEMLAAIEHTEVSQEEIDRSWRAAKRILDFYRKLREVEAQRDKAVSENADLRQRLNHAVAALATAEARTVERCINLVRRHKLKFTGSEYDIGWQDCVSTLFQEIRALTPASANETALGRADSALPAFKTSLPSFTIGTATETRRRCLMRLNFYLTSSITCSVPRRRGNETIS